MDRLKIPTIVSPGLTTPTQRKSPRDLISPGVIGEAEEQLHDKKPRQKFPWKQFSLACLLLVGLVLLTNNAKLTSRDLLKNRLDSIWKRHDQDDMQMEDGKSTEFDQEFVAAEMAGLAGKSRRHDVEEHVEQDSKSTKYDEEFVAAEMASMAGHKRQNLQSRTYVDGVPQDLYDQTQPDVASRYGQQIRDIQKHLEKRDDTPQGLPKVLDDFVDSDLWVPNDSQLSLAEREQVLQAAKMAGKTRQEALNQASQPEIASEDEVETNQRVWWSREEISADAAQRAMQTKKNYNAVKVQTRQEKPDEETAYISQRAKAMMLQLQQGAELEKSQTGKPSTADVGTAALPRWSCIVSPTDNGSRVKVGYVAGTSSGALQCQGPNDVACYWYPPTDTTCNQPWGSGPIAVGVESGVKCQNYNGGWCGAGRQVYPVANTGNGVASPNWKCVLSPSDGNSYVMVGYVVQNNAYTPDFQLKCQGPSNTACTWYWDVNCQQRKSAATVDGMGMLCYYYGGGWCGAARQVLPINPTPAPPPPVNNRPTRNGADWMCIQNGTDNTWAWVSYVSYDFNKIQCRGATYTQCTLFTDNTCKTKVQGSWDLDWYWEAGVSCLTKGTDGPGWCQNARKQLPPPYYYPAVQGGAGPGVVGYFPNWNSWAAATYDFTSVSVVCYAFAQASPSGDIVPGEQLTDGGMMWQLNVNAKKKYPNLKTMISFGGGGQSSWFSALAANSGARKAFARNVANYIATNGFDGVDLDWEYPNPASDEPMNLLLLLQDVRAALPQGKLLTMAVTPMPNLYKSYPYDYAQVVDWINVMTYDITGSWGSYVGYPSALFPDSSTPHGTDGVSTAAWRWFYAGMPKQKISMGAAFYGYGWQVLPGVTNGGMFAASQGVATNVPYSDGSGAFIWRLLRPADSVLSGGPWTVNAGWQRTWRSPANMVSLYNPQLNAVLVVEDVDSVREKAKWTKLNGFGGVSIWDISMDYQRELLGSLCTAWWTNKPLA